jgi:nitroreductase
MIDPAALPHPPAPGAPAPPVQASLETLTRLAQRRSSKPFHLAEAGPSRAQIEALLRLGARCPDHGKLTPWRFIVFDGDARREAGEALSAIAAQKDGASPETVQAAKGMLARAACVIAVISTAVPHPKIPEWEQHLSAGAVCFNLLIAAEAMGFGAVWLTGWAAYDEPAKTALGIGQTERVAGFIYLGAQSQPAEERPRPDVAALTTWYGAPAQSA